MLWDRELPNAETAEVRDCRTPRLPNSEASGLRNCRAPELPNSETAGCRRDFGTWKQRRWVLYGKKLAV